MTTKNSPRAQLRRQAKKVAHLIKAAERGETIDKAFAERLAAARATPSFKVAIMMDDKILTVEMAWTTIEASSEKALYVYILDLMREKRRSLH